MDSISMDNHQAQTSSCVDNNFKSLLSTIDEKVNATLKSVANNKQSKKVSLDNDFEDFFVRLTTQQIKESYRQFVCNRTNEINTRRSFNRSESAPATFGASNSAASKRTFDAVNLSSSNNSLYLEEESSKPPAKKVQLFSKSQSDDDLTYTPLTPTAINVIGTEVKCNVCFETFKSKKFFIIHKLKSGHSESSASVVRTPEYLQPKECSFERVVQRKLSPQAKPIVQPIKCRFCPKEFVRMTSLKKHEEEHRKQNEEKKKVCTSTEAQNKLKLKHSKLSVSMPGVSQDLQLSEESSDDSSDDEGSFKRVKQLKLSPQAKQSVKPIKSKFHPIEFIKMNSLKEHEEKFLQTQNNEKNEVRTSTEAKHELESGHSKSSVSMPGVSQDFQLSESSDSSSDDSDSSDSSDSSDEEGPSERVEQQKFSPQAKPIVEPIKFKFCSKEFVQMTSLKKHEEELQTQNNEKVKVQKSTEAKKKPSSLKCKVCSRQFSTRLMLNLHQQNHRKPK